MVQKWIIYSKICQVRFERKLLIEEGFYESAAILGKEISEMLALYYQKKD